MAADGHRADFRTSTADVGDECSQLRFLGIGRRQHRSQEPARLTTQASDVVGADLDRVPTGALGREGDGVGRQDKEAVAGFDDRRVPPNARPHEHPLVDGEVAQQFAKELRRELARTHVACAPGPAPTD